MSATTEPDMTTTIPCLHICITCGQGPEGGGRAGARLYEALASISLPGDVRVAPVKCLSRCNQGIAGCLTDPRKWSWLLRGLEPEYANDLADYLQAYARSASGVVLPSRRPPSLARVVCGRIPAFMDVK